MNVRYYGLYDTVAKNMVSIFTSQNDDVCLRSCIKMVQEPNSDVTLLKDCIVQFLFSIDSETGLPVESKKETLASMATLIDKFGGDSSSDNKSIVQLRQDFELMKKAFSGYKELDKKCQSIMDLFLTRVQSLEKRVDDIIGGKIKCQKYKKQRAK